MIGFLYRVKNQALLKPFATTKGGSLGNGIMPNHLKHVPSALSLSPLCGNEPAVRYRISACQSGFQIPVKSR